MCARPHTHAHRENYATFSTWTFYPLSSTPQLRVGTLMRCSYFPSQQRNLCCNYLNRNEHQSTLFHTIPNFTINWPFLTNLFRIFIIKQRSANIIFLRFFNAFFLIYGLWLQFCRLCYLSLTNGPRSGKLHRNIHLQSKIFILYFGNG